MRSDVSISRIAAEPDEDAVMPQPLRVWSWRTIWAVVGAGIGGGLGGTCLGTTVGGVLQNGRAITVLGILAGLLGAGLSTLGAYRSARRMLGKGQRVSNRALPANSPELPRLPRSHFVSTSPIPPRPMPPRHVDRLIGSKAAIRCVAVSPDGLLALAGNDEGRVILWDVRTGFELFSMPAYSARTSAVAFSPDGALMAATGIDESWKGGPASTVHVWDSATGQELRQIDIDTGIFSMCFLPDGRQLLLGGRDYLRVWELDGPSAVSLIDINGTLLYSDQIHAVAVDAEGKAALGGCYEHQTIWLVNLARAERVRKLGVNTSRLFMFRKPTVTSLAFSPDGLRAVSGCLDETARVWSVLTGECKLVFRGHCGFWGWRGVVGVAWLPYGARAMSASEDGTLRVWDVNTGEELRRYHHGGAIRCLGVTSDGRMAVTGGRDGVVRVHTIGGN